MLYDRLTQVKNRQFEKTALNEEQNIDNSSGPPVAVEEGVDRLELIMNDWKLNQRVEAIFGMDEIFEVLQFISDNRFAFRRCINDFTGRSISDCCSGGIPDSGLMPLDDLDEFDKQIRREN